MRRAARLLLAILREIGDESAYHRYLMLHKIPASGAAWRRFSDGRHKARYARARCC